MTPEAVSGELVYVAGGGRPPGLWLATPAGLVPFEGGTPLMIQPPMTSPTAAFGGMDAAPALGALASPSSLLMRIVETFIVGLSVEVLAHVFKR